MITILVLLLFGSVNGQDLITEGAEWFYNLVYFGSPDIGFNRCYIDGDTVIMEKNCQIFVQEKYNCNGRPLRNYIYKEDQKIYYFDSGEERFKKLYDFALNSGDTMELETWEHLGFKPFYIRVDSISNFEANSRLLKMFHVTYGYRNHDGEIHFPENSFRNSKIIEDIGSSENFFHFWDNGFCDHTYSFELRCFTAPEYPTVHFSEDDCTTVPTSDFQLYENVEVYPNPVNEELHISLNGQNRIVGYRLYDLIGKIIPTNHESFESNTLLIKLENIESQMCILELIVEGGIKQTKVCKKIILARN